jgi:AraC family transcriptional regulator
MFNSQSRRPKRNDTAEFHSRAIQRVISRIRERLDETLSLREMAAVAYMSRYHFNRTFRQVTGVPPRHFFFGLRLEAATRMLLDTDNSITDICFDVGYNSLGTFIRRFSTALGVSPMRLRMLGRAPASSLLALAGNDVGFGPITAGPSIRGRVQAPPSFSGPIFIGLFPGPIPEGAPLACAICLKPEAYLLAPVPRGRHYVFALGLPWPDTVNDYFRYDTAVRAGGELVTVADDTVECAEICLREALPTDPPILLNLPVLLTKNTIRNAA